MSALSKENRGARFAIYLAYLFPAVLCALTALLFALPRFYFSNNGETHESMGLFTLIDNTWSICQDAFEAKTIGPDTMNFAYVMSFCVILFWIGFVWFIILALHSLLCTGVAFASDPTSTLSNRTKKLFLFAWFNHPVYVIFHLIPLLISLFPQILLSQYASKLGISVKIHYFGIPDPWILALATIASLALFFATLTQQQELHLDMFRLYKKRSSTAD